MVRRSHHTYYSTYQGVVLVGDEDVALTHMFSVNYTPAVGHVQYIAPSFAAGVQSCVASFLPYE